MAWHLSLQDMAYRLFSSRLQLIKCCSGVNSLTPRRYSCDLKLVILSRIDILIILSEMYIRVITQHLTDYGLFVVYVCHFYNQYWPSCFWYHMTSRGHNVSIKHKKEMHWNYDRNNMMYNQILFDDVYMLSVVLLRLCVCVKGQWLSTTLYCFKTKP